MKRLFFGWYMVPFFLFNQLYGMDGVLAQQSDISAYYKQACRIQDASKEKRRLLKHIVRSENSAWRLIQRDQIETVKGTAAFDLGRQYEKGWEDKGGSYKKAAGYYEKALNFTQFPLTQHPHAAYRLAKLYVRGDGVTCDKMKAITLLKDVPDPIAKCLLGELYEEQNLIADALRCYESVYEQNGKAAFRIGRLLERGLINAQVTSDFYFCQAAVLGDTNALRKLASRTGNDTTLQLLFADVSKKHLDAPLAKSFSMGWFEKAAQSGDCEAMMSIAYEYHLQGSENDEDKAVEWLCKAMRAGHEPAHKALQEKAVVSVRAQVALAKAYQSPGKYHSDASAYQYYSQAMAKGHAEGFYGIACLGEKISIESFRSARDVHCYYQELHDLFAQAMNKGYMRAHEDVERVRTIAQSIAHVHPEFNNFLFLKLRNLQAFRSCTLEPEFLIWAAYSTELCLRRFNETIQGALVEALLAILNLNKQDHLKRCVLRRIVDLLESKSFARDPLSEAADNFRIQEFMKIFEGIKLLLPCAPLFLDPRVCYPLKRTSAGIEDLRIEVFNSLFIARELDERVYQHAVEELIALFKTYAANGTITMQDLKDDESQKIADEATLRQLLTYYSTIRYKQRIIKIASLMKKLDVITQRAQLASWAVAGLHCSIRAEQETYNFYIRNMTDTEQIDREHIGLDMRIALCLAELRKNCFALLVPIRTPERLHQITYLERRMGKKLALVGDPSNFTDTFENVAVLDEFKRMTDEKIQESVLACYRVSDMVACIMNEANKKEKSRLSVKTITEYFQVTLKLGDARTNELIGQLYEESTGLMTEVGAKILLHHFGYLETTP